MSSSIHLFCYRKGCHLITMRRLHYLRCCMGELSLFDFVWICIDLTGAMTALGCPDLLDSRNLLTTFDTAPVVRSVIRRTRVVNDTKDAPFESKCLCVDCHFENMFALFDTIYERVRHQTDRQTDGQTTPHGLWTFHHFDVSPPAESLY